MSEPTVLLVSRDQLLAQTIRGVSDSIPRLRMETCGETNQVRRASSPWGDRSCPGPSARWASR